MLAFGSSVTDQVGPGGQAGVGADVFSTSKVAIGNSADTAMISKGVKLGEMSEAGREDSGNRNGELEMRD